MSVFGMQFAVIGHLTIGLAVDLIDAAAMSADSLATHLSTVNHSVLPSDLSEVMSCGIKNSHRGAWARALHVSLLSYNMKRSEKG